MLHFLYFIALTKKKRWTWGVTITVGRIASNKQFHLNGVKLMESEREAVTMSLHDKVPADLYTRHDHSYVTWHDVITDTTTDLMQVLNYNWPLTSLFPPCRACWYVPLCIKVCSVRACMCEFVWVTECGSVCKRISRSDGATKGGAYDRLTLKGQPSDFTAHGGVINQRRLSLTGNLRWPSQSHTVAGVN